VTDSQIDQLIAAARAMAPADRLRVARRVIDGLPAEDRARLVQDAAGTAAETSSEARAPSMLGLFADEPELVDEVCRQVYADRATIRPRPFVE
jgi:hypothetical protein